MIKYLALALARTETQHGGLHINHAPGLTIRSRRFESY